MRKSLWAFCLGLSLTSLNTAAKVEHNLRYTKAQAYQAALRHLRVDAGYTITEKDSDSGYLLFEYPLNDGKKSTNGSIEVVEREDSIALIVQLPQLPLYHERMLAQGLLKKLHDDYGDPPRAKETPRKKETPEKPEKSEEDKKKLPSPPIQRAP
jgi:hypothetical protein